MSQPKRYIACTFVHYNKDGKIGMTESRRVEDPFGEYVQWSDYIEVEKYKDKLLSDYAALAAEKEALVQQGIRDHGDWRSKLNFLEADYKAEVARLTAENERLREAGDRLAFHAQEDGTGWELHDAARVWLATKEGGRK